MNEEDWREIVQLIQLELRNIGHDTIADLSNYELQERSERRLPHPQHLVKEMLDALHRELSSRSTATVRNSLAQLRQLIDEGERPNEAVVWFDDERSLVEGRDARERLVGNEGAPQAIEDLEQLIGQLAEIGFGGDL